VSGTTRLIADAAAAVFVVLAVLLSLGRESRRRQDLGE
jgi:hypothetical protein